MTHSFKNRLANSMSFAQIKQALTLLFVTSTLLASTAFTTVAHASDSQSFTELKKARIALALYGYSCRNKVDGRYLQQGDEYVVYTTLLEGNDYVLVAAGNVHVRDIDIVLHDENHNTIATDNSNDATPMVKVSPKWTGSFHAKVKMHRGKGYSNLMVCYR